jgi:methyl-accepting chemotaxis protein
LITKSCFVTVVVSEIRNLAGRSATATKEIKTLIKDSVEKVEEGAKLVNESGETLGGIVVSVKTVTDVVAEIAAASQEQSSGIAQVHKAVLQMDEMTQQNASLVEEASAASETVGAQAQELNTIPWLAIKPEFQFIFDPMFAKDDAILFGTRLELSL